MSLSQGLGLILFCSADFGGGGVDVGEFVLIMCRWR